MLFVLAACAGTTYDSSVTTIAAADVTTTTRPSGSAAELLTSLLDEAGALSDRIVDDRDERQALDRIEALWAASRDEIQANHPELVVLFEQSVAMCRMAVERNRPADADKAARNLATLAARVV